MKKILYLTFYFEPDLSAGSFRNSSLVKELSKQVDGYAAIDIITTLPNRYNTFNVEALKYEERGNYTVKRLEIPKHKNGMKDQIFSFISYYRQTIKHIHGKKYDLIVVSSSRFFSTYLGYRIAKKTKTPLYLDIRDIFTDTMKDVLKSSILKISILPFLKSIERQVFNYASHINLISGGFKFYFSKFKQKNYSIFSNGIDEEFLNLPTSLPNNKPTKIITYAGNIGEGQGLHKIIPLAAKELGAGYKFKIVGDGGAKGKLIDEITRLDVKNIELHPPVKRDELLKIYSDSDFLFIHLNDYEAFKKVLPSKIFESAAYDKPIIAGVAGFSNQFLKENVSNLILFQPCDVTNMVNQLKNYSYKNEIRSEFINKFKRENINREMAASIISYL